MTLSNSLESNPSLANGKWHTDLFEVMCGEASVETRERVRRALDDPHSSTNKFFEGMRILNDNLFGPVDFKEHKRRH